MELSNDNKKDICFSINNLNNEIEKCKSQIKLIKSTDFTKPVTEEVWHQLCKTSLRSSELLAVLVKNTFPKAENVVVGCNYVNFDLIGFKIRIPTTNEYSIDIDTSWYFEDLGEPVLKYTTNIETLKEYFELVDNKAGWYKCAKKRLTYGDTAPKWFLFFAWWGKYKWKDPHRERFEQALEQENKWHEKEVKKYYKNKAEMKRKTELLFTELLPMVDKFSSVHNRYDAGYITSCPFTIDDIKKIEGKV